MVKLLYSEDVRMGFNNDVKDEDIYMIHCTNFFPKNHKILSTYDGNLIFNKEITNGETVKNCITRSHRHTVHFSLNSIVGNTGDGKGNWDDINMIVVEPYKYHKNEFIQAPIGSDAFIYGSVELSDEAMIFINKNDMELIPEDEIDKWNIVTCDRSVKGTVKSYLGEKLEDYELNNPGHAHSNEYGLEQGLQCRDLAINYIRDNNFNGISPLKLTKSEFFEIIDLYKIKDNKLKFETQLPYFDCYLEESERGKYDDDLFYIISLSGFYLDNEGFVQIKSDKEIYNIIKSWEKEETPVKYKYDNELIRNGKVLYKEYDECLKNKEIDKALSNCKCDFNQLDEKTKDIIKSYRPKNFSNGEYFIKMVYIEENIIEFFVDANNEEKGKILKNKLSGVENIEDIYVGDEIPTFMYDMEGQKDNESYKNFYSRLKEVKDAFIDIVFSKEDIKDKYIFTKNGVINKEKSKKLWKDIKNATDDTRWGLIKEKSQEINREIEKQNNKEINSFKIGELKGRENDKY